MNWLSFLINKSSGNLFEKIGSFVDKLHLSGEEKQAFQLELRKMAQAHDFDLETTMRMELDAKQKVLIAELTQGDNFTKRARPTVVYAGLFFIFINYCLVPFMGLFTKTPIRPLALPTEFWVGWSGIVATWSIGRSMEKRGIENKFTAITNGHKFSPSILE